MKNSTALACFLLPALSLCTRAEEPKNDWEKSRPAGQADQTATEPHPLLKLQGPFQPNDASLSKHQVPKWFSEARVGLSMHWGVYAVPGWAPAGVNIGESYAEWYGQKIGHSKAYQEYHRTNYGDKRYDGFIPEFKAGKFDADAWAAAMKENGVRYYFITSKHHDGFCLWDTRLTGRNSMKMGPKRDLLGELAAACRKHGIKVGFYYSLYEWHNPLYLRDHDPKNKARYDAVIADGSYTGLIPKDRYVDDFMIPQLVELTEKYHPDLLYFDGEWDHPEPFWRMREFVAWYYNRAAARGQEVLVNDRFGKGLRGKVGDMLHVEYAWGAEARGGTKIWAEWRGFGNSYGYNRNEKAYITPAQAIRTIINCASDNGNVEFNIGPMADGTIPETDMGLLRAMGAWLKTNGSAIYGSTRSPVGKPAWGRITHQPAGRKLYLHVYDWPAGGQLTVEGIRNPVRSARLLAGGSALTVTAAAGVLTLAGLPAAAPDPAATVIELVYDGDPASP